MILPSFLSALIGLTHLSERLVSLTPDLLRKSTPEWSVYTFRGVRAAEVYVNGYVSSIVIVVIGYGFACADILSSQDFKLYGN